MENKKVTVKLFYKIFYYSFLATFMFWRKKHYKFKIGKLLFDFSSVNLEKIYLLGIHVLSIHRVVNCHAYTFLKFPIIVVLNKYNRYEIAILGIIAFKKKNYSYNYKNLYDQCNTNNDSLNVSNNSNKDLLYELIFCSDIEEKVYNMLINEEVCRKKQILLASNNK